MPKKTSNSGMPTFFPPPPIDTDNEPLEALVAETRPFLSADVINTIIQNGDLSKLSANDLTSYYVYRCKMIGIDPATKPFDLLTLQGKKILYANKACAAQLRDLRKISTQIIEEREWNGLLTIRVRAWYPDGRQHEDEGFASLANLGGDALGNARLKAITKATRRSILHLCGLGEMDETEVETIPGAVKVGSAMQQARDLLIPKIAPSGSDAIQIVDLKGADTNTNTVEVLDTNHRVWHFMGKDAVDIALKAVGQSVSVMVDYSIENGQYIVRNARL